MTRAIIARSLTGGKTKADFVAYLPVQAMAKLGLENSRMKDFYDVAALASGFPFDGPTLVRAIAATFNRRQTPIPESLPLALTPAFADNALKQQQWAALRRVTSTAFET